MRIRPALLVFFVVAVLLILLQGNRFVLTNDEGILLDPAQKLAAGARLYVDFFGYMSPGSYWIQALLFKLAGVSLWAGRIPVILDFSLQCALVFWLTARLASRRAALAAVIIFTGFQIADPSFLTAQHRWDSGSLALAGICVALRFPSMWGLAGSGMLLAAASWCTPSIGFVGAALALWLWLAPERRRFLLPFAGGIAVVTAMAVGWLATHGSWSAFIEQMLWLQRNYATVNVMPYGSVIGGYARVIEDAHGLERFLRIFFLLFLMIPAILPPVALLLWGFAFLNKSVPPEIRSVISLLLLAMVAFVLGIFPRADVFHLALVAAIPYVLTTVALARFLSLRVSAQLAFSLIPVAVLFSLNNITGAFHLQAMATPVGKVRVPENLADNVRQLLTLVKPQQTLFVHPYMPIYYFVTQGDNPSRYCYLNGGMMTKVEEMKTLAQLQSRPPEWLLYMPLSREEFLRVFPNANGDSARFETLENWLEKNYAPYEQPPLAINGYRLWHILRTGEKL